MFRFGLFDRENAENEYRIDIWDSVTVIVIVIVIVMVMVTVSLT